MVGFIGLGIMGKPMAKNLLKAGCQLMVYDVNLAVVEELAALGARPSDPEGIGRDCEVVFTILPTGAVVKQVLFEEQGVAASIKPGSIVCDMSSVTPQESQYCSGKLKEKGVGFVDAPVSGGEPGAGSWFPRG